jgi:hypothetical protein
VNALMHEFDKAIAKTAAKKGAPKKITTNLTPSI